MDPLEILWDKLLSRQPEEVVSAFTSLSEDEKGAILNHLKRMATEPDWHPEQRLSAQAALDIIGKQGTNPEGVK